VPGAAVYNFMYRARLARLFWSRVDRPEIRALVEGGPCDPARLAPPGGGRPQAIDLGCGEGAVAIYLARRGFTAIGVDFSAAALWQARRAAAFAGLDDTRVRFIEADLTDPSIAGVAGPFDLLVDYGTLDDLGHEDRRRAASLIDGLARPGSRFFLYAFEARRASLPWFSMHSPSRLAPEVFEPGEVEALFGDSWDVERLPRHGPPWISNYLLTRRRD
jgi:SAM-dependent methyltransferase